MLSGILTSSFKHILFVASLIALLLIIFTQASYAATNDSAETSGGNRGEQVEADIQNATCAGADLEFKLNPSESECAFGGLDANEKLNQIVTEIINFFSIIIGIIAVLMIIVGGFRYIISGGDSANVSTAKNTILYAIIGLIVVVFAQTIVKFILSKTVDIVN